MKSDTEKLQEAMNELKFALKTEGLTKHIYQAMLWVLEKGNDLCERGLQWLNRMSKK